MNEKDLFKKAIEENLLKKDMIRRQAINTVESNLRKEVPIMKRKFVVSILTIAFFITTSVTAYAAVDFYQYYQADSFLGEIGIKVSELSRSDAKKVYKDIKSDSFSYDTTTDILMERAEEMGIENVPHDGKEIYQAIVEYNGLIHTGKITTAQIREIKAGTTYKEIVKALGSTKDVGSGLHVLQYVVDGDKIFYLSYADENDICLKSGEELLKTLEEAKQDNEDENTFNATLTQRMDNNILVSCPTFKNFDVISLAITDKTIIVFENGQKASIEEVRGELTITISGAIRESYPPQGEAVRIVIK